MTFTKSLLSFQLFAHQGLSDPEVTASSSPQNCCWLLNTYTQACPGLLRHPFSPAHLGQCLLSWALCYPRPNTSVIHANGLAPLAQPALRSRGTSPTLHAGGGGERWKRSLPLRYSFTNRPKFVPSSILLSTINSQASNKVKSHPFLTTRHRHALASPRFSAEAAIDGFPSSSPPSSPPDLPTACDTAPHSRHHMLTPSLWASCREFEPSDT